MFDADICARRLHKIQKGLGFKLKRYTPEQALERTLDIPAWNKRKKAPEQGLSHE